MYLARLHRYNAKLNNVVTFLDDLGLAEAKQADAEIAAGKYKGPLHGIPWGAKDIISVKGYKTTWGSAAFKEQLFDYDASVVEMLRDAGAVLIAKLTTGELAAGRQLVRRPDQEPVGSDAGLERIVGRPVVGDGGRLRRLRHRHRDERIDPQPGGALRPGRPAADVRPHQPLRRDGAVVDAGSARPDLPLRRGLRDRDAGDRQARRPRHERVRHAVQLERAARRQEAARRLHQGVVRRAHERRRPRPTPRRRSTRCARSACTNFVPVTVPDVALERRARSASSRRCSSTSTRARASMKRTRSGGRPNGRLVPAVEYLQSQRVRMMMMMELAKATADVDVYVVASNNTGVGARRRRPAARRRAPAPRASGERSGAAAAGGAAAVRRRRRSATSRWPTWPAIRRSTCRTASPRPARRPTSSFFARPFGEMELLALAKAYQDAARFHLVKPTRIDG